MKNWFLVGIVAISLSACTPAIGDVASRAASRAVERAVDTAISTLVRRTVDRIVNNIFDLVIASAIDRAFGIGAEVEYTEDFALELYTGRYEVTISGDAPVVGTFRYQGGEPAGDELFLGAGLRTKADDGSELIALSLFYDEGGATPFVVTLIDAEDDQGVRQLVAGLSINNNQISYTGQADLRVSQLSRERYAGSFTAVLSREDTGESVQLSATFDVPINPPGSLLLRSRN